MIKDVMIAIVTASLVLLSSASSRADTLQDIETRGTLVVGVKADFPPWGFRNEAGQLVGMEIDMAKDVARRLSVKLELVPVLSSNRMQFLQDGKIDLMIATMSVTEERQKAVGVIEPYYYATIIGALVRNDTNIHSENQLAGRMICTINGVYFYNTLSETYVKGSIKTFQTIPEVESALLNGACEGFVFDDVYLLYKIKSQPQKWANFDIVQFLHVRPAAWGIAVRKEDHSAPWGRYISEVVSDWHRTGKLLALEKQWVGQQSMALRWLSDKVSRPEGKLQ
jgi:polar amino acid transport system substrate-binding protein